MKISTVVIYAIAVPFTFVAHEGAHWAMGDWLGYDMFLRANSAGLATGLYRSEIDAQLVTAAGPAFTLLQGFVAFALVRAFGANVAFPFLLSALLMRVLAAGVSLGNPNDEMRLGVWLGLGEWTVFAAVIGGKPATVVRIMSLKSTANGDGFGGAAPPPVAGLAWDRGRALDSVRLRRHSRRTVPADVRSLDRTQEAALPSLADRLQTDGRH